MVKKYYNSELILPDGTIKKIDNLDINDLRQTLECEMWQFYKVKIPLSNDTIYNLIKRPQKTNLFIRQKIKITINEEQDDE